MARTLKIFMRGKSVGLLHEVLRRMGYDIADQKNLFGTTTREAVKSYQKQHGLKLTGLVDEALMKQMQGGAPAPAEEQINVKAITLSNNQAELDTLVRLLIKKEVFSQEEWDTEKNKVVPSNLI
jgi:peptidoglycan hydrolase-like protein with peptidoglycan-binding domain